MKKSTKGAAAAAAAAVLLLGGAGTLAYWTATDTVDSGQIASGRLGLTPITDGGWTLNGAAVDIEDVEIVPGDELEFTGGYTILAEGDNLEGTVSVNAPNVTGGLETYLTPQVTTTVDGAAPTADQVFTEANNGDRIVVDATFTFPFGSAADNTSQDLTADLSDFVVTLTQTEAGTAQ